MIKSLGQLNIFKDLRKILFVIKDSFILLLFKYKDYFLLRLSNDRNAM